MPINPEFTPATLKKLIDAHSDLGAALIWAQPSDDQTVLNRVRLAHKTLERLIGVRRESDDN